MSTTFLLGKLNADAIPYDPIVLVTVAMMILGGLAVVAGITYFKLLSLIHI